MPPKAANKKKKGAKDAPVKPDDKDLLRRAEHEVARLQTMLEMKSQEALLAKQQELAWRQQVSKLQSSLENQRVDMQDVTSNMRQQFKDVQEQLSKSGAETERQTKALRAHLSQKDAEIAARKDSQVQQQRQHEHEIAELNKKLNILQSEFTDMLTDTVNRLHVQRRAAYSQIAAA